MKKVILPVIFMVIVIIIVKNLSSEITAPGLIMIAPLGIFIGIMLNKLIFREKKNQ